MSRIKSSVAGSAGDSPAAAAQQPDPAALPDALSTLIASLRALPGVVELEPRRQDVLISNWLHSVLVHLGPQLAALPLPADVSSIFFSTGIPLQTPSVSPQDAAHAAAGPPPQQA